MSDDNWLDDSDTSPVIQSNKQTVTEDKVLTAVDRITSKAIETGYNEGQLDTNIVMVKLEKEFGTSLIQFRTAIAAKLAIVKAISPPRSKAGTSNSFGGNENNNSSRTLFPTLSFTTADKTSSDNNDSSSIDSDVPVIQQIAQRQAKFLAAQQKQQQQQQQQLYTTKSLVSSSSSSSSINTPAKPPKPHIIDILDTDEEAELLLSKQSAADENIRNSLSLPGGSTGPTTVTGKGSVKLMSSLPLILPKQPKRNRSTMLVQIEDNNLELSGDIGAIGRLTTLPNEGIILDLKGHQYGGSIVPCGSFMVVGFQPKEARVETIISDFVQVEHLANMIDSLTGSLTSGTIDPVLLEFQDVDGDETAALAKKYGNDEGDEDEENRMDESERKGSKKKPSGKRKRSSDDDSDSDDAYDNTDDVDESENEGRKRKGKSSSADNNPSIKIYGRAVKVGKKKKSKKKATAKGGSRKKSSK